MGTLLEKVRLKQLFVFKKKKNFALNGGNNFSMKTAKFLPLLV